MNAPAYQVECLITAKGKIFAASKRRIRWRFGYSNREALEQGLSGADCRGEEHEVVLVWSLTSGKQLILADGNEVHFSKGTFTDKFECSWKTKNGHELMVIAHATPPLFQCGGLRQFDLLIDGRSYWHMPQMLQLGRTRNLASSRSTPNLRRYSQQEYLSNSNHSLSSFEASPTQSIPSRRTQSLPKHLLLEPLVPVGDLLSESTPVVSPQNQCNTFEFAPQPLAPPSFQDKDNQAFTSYGPPSAHSQYQMTVGTTWQPQQQAMVTPDSTSQDPFFFASPQQYQESVEVSHGSSPVIQNPVATEPLTPSMHPLSDRQDAMSPIEMALKSLVNFDFPESPQPIQQADLYLSNNASLSEIKAQTLQKIPRKEVMRTYAFDASAVQNGMLVEYGGSQLHPPCSGMHMGATQTIFAQ